jgi:putative zinc finger/helix-turn-helix YgiT family protein
VGVFVPHGSFLNMTRQALKCPECDKRRLQLTITELSGTTHGESFAIVSDALVCPNCGFKTIPTEKMGEFALRVSDAYREKHQLLTSCQIKDRRLDLGMSQQQFANYLGVGSSSVKRWELGQIQDKAMNNLMVLKTDLGAARENVIEVSARLQQPFWAPREQWHYLEVPISRGTNTPSGVICNEMNLLTASYKSIYGGVA